MILGSCYFSLGFSRGNQPEVVDLDSEVSGEWSKRVHGTKPGFKMIEKTNIPARGGEFRPENQGRPYFAIENWPTGYFRFSIWTLQFVLIWCPKLTVWFNLNPKPNQTSSFQRYQSRSCCVEGEWRRVTRERTGVGLSEEIPSYQEWASPALAWPWLGRCCLDKTYILSPL